MDPTPPWHGGEPERESFDGTHARRSSHELRRFAQRGRSVPTTLGTPTQNSAATPFTSGYAMNSDAADDGDGDDGDDDDETTMDAWIDG